MINNGAGNIENMYYMNIQLSPLSLNPLFLIIP